MTIKLVNRGTEGELLLEGRLDSNTAPEAEAIFAQTAERFDTVILNFAGLGYISSAGLRQLLKLQQTMRKKNGELILTHVNKMVMEVLEMTGFAGLLRFQ